MRKVFIPRSPSRYRQRGLLTLTGAGLSPWSISTGDPYFSSVVLLGINESGADGGTTFVDQSSYARALTAAGNAQWDTAQAPTGLTSSLLCDGNGDQVTAADAAALELGSSDFAIEVWFRPASGTNNSDPCGKRSAGIIQGWTYYLTNTTIRFAATSNDSTWDIASDRAIGTITAGAWNHVAVSRDGSTWRGFIEGTIQDAFTFTSTKSVVNNGVAVNMGGTTNQWFNGHVAAFRMTVGSNRGYTASFTVPTLPLLSS